LSPQALRKSDHRRPYLPAAGGERARPRPHQAARAADKAFAERSHWLVWLRLDPCWKTLRSAPALQRLSTE